MPWCLCSARWRSWRQWLGRTCVQRNGHAILISKTCFYVPKSSLEWEREHCSVWNTLRHDPTVWLDFHLFWRKEPEERFYETLKHHFQQWNSWPMACRWCTWLSQWPVHLNLHQRICPSSRSPSSKRSWPTNFDWCPSNWNWVDCKVHRSIPRYKLCGKSH